MSENDRGQTGKGYTEEFKVSGEAVVAKVKELVREGNVRRITIKNEEGHTLIEIPLTLGVIGTVLLPVWAAIGAIAALAANLTIAVERRGKPADDAGADPSGSHGGGSGGDHAGGPGERGAGGGTGPAGTGGGDGHGATGATRHPQLPG